MLISGDERLRRAAAAPRNSDDFNKGIVFGHEDAGQQQPLAATWMPRCCCRKEMTAYTAGTAMVNLASSGLAAGARRGAEAFDRV